MARRLLIVLAVLAALAGCGGGSDSNGEADKTASQILADARQAARDAGSVAVAGSIDDKGTKIDLDLHIGKKTGTGSITIEGTKVDLIRIGDVVYLRAGADFYERIGAGKAASKLLAGRWLKASSTQKDFKDIAQLTDIDDFVTQAVKPEGTLSKGDETTVDGQKGIELKDSEGGSLLVATTGEPYPLVFKGGGTTSGTVTLSDWGEKVAAKAPAGAIDIAMLGRD
jgi:hypothetical protein